MVATILSPTRSSSCAPGDTTSSPWLSVLAGLHTTVPSSAARRMYVLLNSYEPPIHSDHFAIFSELLGLLRAITSYYSDKIGLLWLRTISPTSIFVPHTRPLSPFLGQLNSIRPSYALGIFTDQRRTFRISFSFLNRLLISRSDLLYRTSFPLFYAC